ncbi:MAG: NAD(P)H-hydrate dehydratase [Chlamydiae bacterium]|nr:NAD(P)H-hydrate dehydratase [Chlamydiota bacterium]
MEKDRLQWRKVVTAEEMARVEKLAIEGGDANSEHTGAFYMDKAAEAIQKHVQAFCEERQIPKTLTIIAGKGNKAGDGYSAASLLLEQGFDIVIYQLYPLDACSLLCVERASKFLNLGGKVILISRRDELQKPHEGLIIDAMLGTGFTGDLKEYIHDVIEEVNRWNMFVISIDIPSGVSGDSGKVSKTAIFADETIALGEYKVGHFLLDGFRHANKIVINSFGMSERYRANLSPSFYLISRHLLEDHWPKRLRDDHKYSVGQVLGFAGSSSMAGAAILSMSSAQRSGAGIVKLFHPKEIEEELITAPYELIKHSWDDMEVIKNELRRTKSVIIGPGLGRKEEVLHFLKNLLLMINVPMVLDADALFFYHQLPKTNAAKILTPHHGELKAILGSKGAQEFVDEENVTLVIKGAPTLIYHPHTTPLICPYGSAGMATAGSGDVLSGILGAILARQIEPRLAAAMAVLLHQLIGEAAEKELTEDCMCAGDLIKFLPNVLLDIKKHRSKSK